MKFKKALEKITGQRLVEVDNLAFEMMEQVFDKDGNEIYNSGFYSPNALTNDGQAHMLNVWAREQSNLNKWLMLLNMAAGAAPTKTSTLSTITEAVTINTNGYARTLISSADWGAPALDTGDQQITASQKTFGPFTGDVPVSHVALASVASTFTGTLFLYVSTAYHTANNAARTFVSGESYLVTLRDKQT
jgi:hypothetical protein